MTHFKTILFTLLIGLAFSLFAQENSITGMVVDARNGEPLNGAEVFLKHLKQGTTTDEDGYFNLRLSQKLPVSSDTLIIRFLGYQKYQVALKAYKNRSRIRLQSESVAMQDSVTVHDERLDLSRQEIPHARSVIDFETIELRGSSEIGDLFKTIPSVRIEGNDLTGRRIQIRGSDASEVNVYVDGILINNLGVNGAADLSVISVEDIQTLEVLKGANLPLLGGGAFGGVVNVTSKKNLQRSLYLKTKQGSFDSQYYIGELNMPLSQNFVVNYFGQVNGIKPGIEFFPGEAQITDKTQNNQVETVKQNHNLRMNYYLPKGELSAKFFGYLLDYDKPDWENKRQNYLFAGRYRGDMLGITNFDMNVNYQSGNDDVTRKRFTDRFFTSFESQRLNVKLLKKFVADKNEIQLLAEYFHDEVDIANAQRFGERRIPTYNAGLYENRWSFAGVVAFSNQFADRADITWKTHLGLRDDFIATGDNYVSPSAGFRVEIERPNMKITPYFSYGKNVKIQTLLDNAYLELQDIDQSDTTLNRLQPEESSAFEMGTSISKSGNGVVYSNAEIALAVFRNTIVNKLIRLPTDPSVVLSQIGRNVTSGLEASLKMENFLTPHLNFTGTATVLNISEPLLYPFKPEGSYSATLDFASANGLYFHTTLFYEGQSIGLFPGDVDPNDLKSELVPAFYDMDASIGYRFQLGNVKLNLQAAGFNVLDNSGYQFYLLKKQFFQFSLSVRY